MSKPTDQRPPQVTLAVGLVIGASVLVLLAVWERVSTLGSLELQDAIRDMLAEPPLSGTGLDVPAVTEIIRITAMVAAACACATAILAWYARKPDQSARLWLTVFTVPVFVGGMAVDQFGGAFVAAGAAMLWMQPAREWFATGKWTPPDPEQKDAESRTTTGERSGGAPGSPWGQQPPPPLAPPTEPPPAARPFGEPGPGAHNPYGQPYPPVQPHPGPGQQTQQLAPPPGAYPPPPHGWQPAARPEPRPQAMVTAFVITMVTAGGLFAFALMSVAIAGTSIDVLMTEMERQQPGIFADGLTADQLRTQMLAFGAGALVWSGVALALAGFAMARREWARRGLIASAAFSAGGCLALLGVFPPIVLPAAAAVATVVCLRRVEVRRWFAARAG